jgi:hypothetical protein
MKKRNKKYNPNKHRLNHNSAFDAIRMSLPVTDKAKQTLLLQVHMAIEAFRNGLADTYQFDILASTVDLCELIRNNVFKGAFEEEVELARLGMLRTRDRFTNTGKMGLDGIAMNAVKALADIHEQMLNQITGHELKQFIEKRTNNIRGGNFYKGTAEELQRMAA